MVSDFQDFLDKTPRQIDFMLIAYHNKKAWEMYEKQCLHGFKRPKKPVLFTNKLSKEEKPLTDVEKVIMETVTNSLLRGGKK